jgi:hypothetical protein
VHSRATAKASSGTSVTLGGRHKTSWDLRSTAPTSLSVPVWLCRWGQGTVSSGKACQVSPWRVGWSLKVALATPSPLLVEANSTIRREQIGRFAASSFTSTYLHYVFILC